MTAMVIGALLRHPRVAEAAGDGEGPCQCVEFLKRAKLLPGGKCYAKDYSSPPKGYKKSSTPAKDWVMVIQPGTLGTPTKKVDGDKNCPNTNGAGHVAWVRRADFISPNGSWEVSVTHANWSGDKDKQTHYGCTNVTKHKFTVTHTMLEKKQVTFIKKA
jgi:hypothetical protein